MTNTEEKILKMARINFSGNTYMLSWFNHIQYANGRPHSNAVLILSDIVYWYRPKEERDEFTGQLIGYCKRFESDLLQRSYDAYKTMFGFSHKQTKDALVRLEELGLVKRVFRTITTKSGARISNVMYLDLNVDRLAEISSPGTQLCTSRDTPSELISTHPMDPQVRTNTKNINTKITTERNTAGAREEIHTANFENLRSSESVPVNVKESSSDVKSQPHNRYSGKSGDVFEEDCEGRSGPHDNNLTPPTQSVNASQSVNNSNTRGKNFIHQGENSPLDELYQVGVNEMIPTAWFNIATRKNIPTDKVNDVFGKFKHFYRGREYTKIDWNEKWTRWCDNERQFKDHACQEEKPIEVVVDHSESVEVRRVRQEILRIVGDATYKSWYASCEIKLSSTNIEIIAPTKFNMGWIETNGKNLDSPLRASLGKNVVYKHKQQNPSREARMAS